MIKIINGKEYNLFEDRIRYFQVDSYSYCAVIPYHIDDELYGYQIIELEMSNTGSIETYMIYINDIESHMRNKMSNVLNHILFHNDIEMNRKDFLRIFDHIFNAIEKFKYELFKP